MEHLKVRWIWILLCLQWYVVALLQNVGFRIHFLWLREILCFQHWASRNTASLRPAGKRDTVLKRTWWVCYWESVDWLPLCFLLVSPSSTDDRCEVEVQRKWKNERHSMMKLVTLRQPCLLLAVLWFANKMCTRYHRIRWWTFLVFKCAQPKHYWHLSHWHMKWSLSLPLLANGAFNAVPLLHWRSFHSLLFRVAQFFELPK